MRSSPTPIPQAYEKLVDRLLASPHYGERMALPWLDAARYADSNGFQQDGDTWQWIWRDWVVKALNDDLPFDQFTIWQLAGDLLPDATTEQKIASGFNRNHLLNGEGGAIAEEQRFVNLFDRIDTTATTWLGLTMACAQCHDHKYDPITQRDYYSLLDAFNRVPESGTPQFFSSRIRVAAPFVELPTEENKARIAEFEAQIAGGRGRGESSRPTSAFEGWRLGVFADGKPADGKGLPDALAAILQQARGRADRRREEVARSGLAQALRREGPARRWSAKLPALAKLDGLQETARRLPRRPDPARHGHERRQAARDQRSSTAASTSSRRRRSRSRRRRSCRRCPRARPPNRLGFAQWLVTPEHPLTARVQVNRMWQHFFGAGIVKTAEDFGVQSEYPVHGALLDWLAVEFRERGWSMKAMHRLIVTSATYRQSSRVTPEHRGPRPREPAVCAGEPVPDAVAALARLGAGGRRPARSADRRRARLSLSARRDLGGAGDHQGARLHLSGLLGRRPLSPQPLHVLAADGRPGQHVRRLEPADLPRAVRPRPARRCTPSPRSTTRPGSRPPGSWPSRA